MKIWYKIYNSLCISVTRDLKIIIESLSSVRMISIIKCKCFISAEYLLSWKKSQVLKQWKEGFMPQVSIMREQRDSLNTIQVLLYKTQWTEHFGWIRLSQFNQRMKWVNDAASGWASLNEWSMLEDGRREKRKWLWWSY